MLFESPRLSVARIDVLENGLWPVEFPLQLNQFDSLFESKLCDLCQFLFNLPQFKIADVNLVFLDRNHLMLVVLDKLGGVKMLSFR